MHARAWLGWRDLRRSSHVPGEAMRISKLKSDVDRYRWLALVNEPEMRILNDLHDGPFGPAWKPLRAEWIEEDVTDGKPKSDFPTLGTTPVFSECAVETLLDLLVANGEILPLDVEGEKYFAYNPTRTLDALDQDRSVIVRFPTTGRILDVKQYVFLSDKLDGSAIFRLPMFRGRAFVTDEFAARIRDGKLTGFGLREVWSSEG
jgi:hypothetical protein